MSVPAEISIGGVYLPGLLVVGFAALILAAFTSGLLARIGAYRFVAHRPLLNVSLFTLWYGLLAQLAHVSG